MHIKPFESGAELAAHMHEVRIDLLVYDFDEAAADGVAAALKQRGTQIIGLTSSIDGHIRQRIGAAPFDEVIVKPMSPRFLLERVRSRLSAGSP